MYLKSVFALLTVVVTLLFSSLSTWAMAEKKPVQPTAAEKTANVPFDAKSAAAAAAAAAKAEAAKAEAAKAEAAKSSEPPKQYDSVFLAEQIKQKNSNAEFCKEALNQITEAEKNMLDTCAKFGSPGENNCLKKFAQCAEESKEEAGSPTDKMADKIANNALSMMGSGGAMAQAFLGMGKETKSIYAQPMCKKTVFTAQELKQKEDELKSKITRAGEKSQEKAIEFQDEMAKIKKAQQELQEESLRAFAKDEEAEVQERKTVKTEQKSYLEAQLKHRKIETEVISNFRKILQQKANMDRFRSNPLIYKASIDACKAEKAQKAKITRPDLRVDMQFKKMCQDEALLSYNGQIQTWNEQLASLEQSYKDIQMAKDMDAADKIAQDIERESQMALKAKMNGARIAQSTMKDIELRRQSVQVEMNAQKKNSFDMVNAMTQNRELNEVSTAINNLGEPVTATSAEARAAVQKYLSFGSLEISANGAAEKPEACVALEKRQKKVLEANAKAVKLFEDEEEAVKEPTKEEKAKKGGVDGSKKQGG